MKKLDFERTFEYLRDIKRVCTPNKKYGTAHIVKDFEYANELANQIYRDIINRFYIDIDLNSIANAPILVALVKLYLCKMNYSDEFITDVIKNLGELLEHNKFNDKIKATFKASFDARKEVNNKVRLSHAKKLFDGFKISSKKMQKKYIVNDFYEIFDRDSISNKYFFEQAFEYIYCSLGFSSAYKEETLNDLKTLWNSDTMSTDGISSQSLKTNLTDESCSANISDIPTIPQAILMNIQDGLRPKLSFSDAFEKIKNKFKRK